MTRWKGKPIAGSHAFSPRKRARSQTPRVCHWPSTGNNLLGFMGYKAGMTHAVMVDDLPHSGTKGQEIFVSCTVVETPPLVFFAARSYKKTPYGLSVLSGTFMPNTSKYLSQIVKLGKPNPKFADESKDAFQVRALVHTQPHLVRGVPKKLPEIMEIAIGGSVAEQIEFVGKGIGKQIPVSEAFKGGELLDIIAVTKGYGIQGPHQRFGTKLRKRKHRVAFRRHIGSLGGRGAPTRWTIPAAGQTGYFRRTEYNKRILLIASKDKPITPKGGFINYGKVSGDYLLLKGSVPGPKKRLLCLRHATRPKKDWTVQEPQLAYVSLESKQGV